MTTEKVLKQEQDQYSPINNKVPALEGSTLSLQRPQEAQISTMSFPLMAISPSVSKQTLLSFPQQPSIVSNNLPIMTMLKESSPQFNSIDDNRLLIETSMALSESMMMSTLNPMQVEDSQMRHTYPLSAAHALSEFEEQSSGSSSGVGGMMMTSEILDVSGSGDSGGLYLQRSSESGSNEAGISLESALGEEDDDIWRHVDIVVPNSVRGVHATGELQSPEDSFIAISNSIEQQQQQHVSRTTSYKKLLPSQGHVHNKSHIKGQTQIQNQERLGIQVSSFGTKTTTNDEVGRSASVGKLTRRNSGGIMALTESAAARIASTSRPSSRNSSRPPSRASTGSGEVDTHSKVPPWKPR
jgi:hypothetical protein